MRLLVQEFAAVIMRPANRVDIAGDVEMALRAQEEAVAHAPRAARGLQKFVQIGVCLRGLDAEIAVATLRVEPHQDGKRLDQGGFARAVLTHEEGDRLVETQRAKIPDRGDVERLGVKRGHRVHPKGDFNEEVAVVEDGHGRAPR